MQEIAQSIRFSDLGKVVGEFIQGNTVLSTVKDFFSVFWNGVHNNSNLDDEIIAKAEILNIAVEAFENGDFTIEDLKTIVQKEIPSSTYDTHPEMTPSV